MTEVGYPNRRGLTVLALVLLILALVIGGFFLVPYLQSIQVINFLSSWICPV
jgi:hypothetical protein